MSSKVNLLPQEDLSLRAARRTTRATVVLLLTFVVLLGGVYGLKLNEIEQAELERDVVQADVNRLQAEVAQLEPFRRLADELEARNALLTAAMAQEISVARVMTDLSLAFPRSSSLRSLQWGVTAPPAPDAVVFGTSLASLTYEGYSVERFAPGVETVVVDFDKVRSFFNSYISTAALEEIGTTEITGFTGTVQLNDDALTGRYADGLPEGDVR